MTDPTEIPAWTALFFGLFSLAAAIGEFRARGTWQRMLEEIAASPALIVVLSLFEVAMGAIVYLANPWGTGDGLASLMHVLGGVMALEGLVIAAFGGNFIRFWLRLLAPLMRAWLVLAVVLGIALVAIAIPRF